MAKSKKIMTKQQAKKLINSMVMDSPSWKRKTKTKKQADYDSIDRLMKTLKKRKKR